jgi:hypothetical protein
MSSTKLLNASFSFQFAFHRSRNYFTTDGRSVSQYVEPILGLVTRYYFLSESCCLKVAVLWEKGSAVCSSITQWSGSRRTSGHTLLSHLRLLKLGGPDSRIYIPQEQGGIVIPPVTGYAFQHRKLDENFLPVAACYYQQERWQPHSAIYSHFQAITCLVRLVFNPITIYTWFQLVSTLTELYVTVGVGL